MTTENLGTEALQTVSSETTETEWQWTSERIAVKWTAQTILAPEYFMLLNAREAINDDEAMMFWADDKERDISKVVDQVMLGDVKIHKLVDSYIKELLSDDRTEVKDEIMTEIVALTKKKLIDEKAWPQQH